MKTLCTASIFSLLVGAFAVGCYIKVPFNGEEVPLIIALGFPILILATVGALWMAASEICTGLRKRFSKPGAGDGPVTMHIHAGK